MRCLVLGGAGFIGSHIVDALIARNHQVRVFDLPKVSARNLRQCADEIELIEGDFNNENDIARALTGIEVVVHLVCSTLPGPSNQNPVYDVEKNVIGAVHLLDRAVENKVRKIVFASSGGAVYGLPQVMPIPETHRTNPVCSYGITKLMVEKYLELYRHLYGLEYTVLRPGNPYGERQRIDGAQGAVAVFLGKLLLDRTITIWGDGSVVRDYFYIGDLASAFVKVCESATPSNIYNIGGGKTYSLNELLEAIAEITGKTPKVEYTPARKSDVAVNSLEISRAKEELGWSPRVSLPEGLARTWEWLRRADLNDLLRQPQSETGQDGLDAGQ